MNILVLDDDSDYAIAIAQLIEKMGHTVTISTECLTAGALADNTPFDVILADVDLPDGDGRQTCGLLRMDGASQAAYIIAVTGRVDLGDEDFPGFDGYLRKPVTYDVLDRILEEWRVAAGLDYSPSTKGL